MDFEEEQDGVPEIDTHGPFRSMMLPMKMAYADADGIFQGLLSCNVNERLNYRLCGGYIDLLGETLIFHFSFRFLLGIRRFRDLDSLEPYIFHLE